MTKSPQFSEAIRSWMDVFMHRSWRSWGQFAKSTGLSMPQFSILMQLHYRGNCAIGDISERFDITNAAASQLVDKLVQSSFIKREEDPQDRRAKMLNLTDKGKDLIQRGIEERYRWVDQLSEKLTVEERARVTDALNIMTRAAQELEAEPVQEAA
ncbi:MAG TPA: MarR family transcriptional regulator [Anaerolineales bacterium]|nr:MarR family transcriptional regulator [Anaerolineales bacterium]